ncbi:MAG: transporter substrate-binding domain-containing protein [Gemmatimonadetes bacterium]|nr:transporter substrate-binding domain-containing protein [Gemmatimonadota bacterium]
MPRNAEPVTLDHDIASTVSEDLGLELRFVSAADHSTMVEKLLQGEGDIVAANLTDTPDRRARTTFSVPYHYVDEYLIVPAGNSAPDEIEDLAGVEISVRPSSSYYQTLLELQKKVPELRIGMVPETMTTEQIVDAVSRNEYEATVCDDNLWQAVKAEYDNLAAPMVLAHNRMVVLLMRPEDTDLKEKIDEILLARQILRKREEVFTDDLDGLKKRGRLRMITRNNALTYFIHRGMQVGYEYELLHEFADRNDLRLEIVIPDSHAELLDYLNEGKGDIVAAAMTISDERGARAAFTLPYNDVEEVVVVRSGEGGISSFRDLAGRKLHVRNSSSFRATLEAAADSIEGLEIVGLPDDVETEDIMVGVDEGIYDVTMADSNLLEVEQAYGRNLKAAFRVKPASLGWAVRRENPALLAALDQYIKKEKRGLFFNLMHQKYFENLRTIAKSRDSLRVDLSGQLSPYDDHVKKYAEYYGQDWRLITAQMYQESRFDPNAVSWVGAQGLMQVMPATGKQLGFTRLEDPDEGIHAGVKYMDHLIKRFDPKLPMEFRIHFALASYNAGYGHLLDARRLARELGKDPNQWFGHVEEAMLLLSRPEYYKRARYGFVRGGQPVHYVENIKKYYGAYVEVLASKDPGQPVRTTPLSSR